MSLKGFDALGSERMHIRSDTQVQLREPPGVPCLMGKLRHSAGSLRSVLGVVPLDGSGSL